MIYTCTFAWCLMAAAVGGALLAVVLVRLLMGDCREPDRDDGRNWRRD